MKRIRYYFNPVQILAVSLVVLAFGCKKEDEVLSLSRPFSPSTVTITNGETSAKITWTAALFTTPGNVSYTVEVSKTTDFTAIDYTVTTPDVTTTITDDKIAIKQNYYARVKAKGVNGQGDSNWSISPVFRITGEQYLNPVTASNLTDVAVQLTWRLPAPDLTKITITPPIAIGTPFDAVLTAPDIAAGLRVVPGLVEQTTYSAEIFAGAKSKGIVTFKTLASIAGPTIVDISGTASDILQTTVNGAADGSIIVLKRGQIYTLSSAFPRSVMLRSKIEFGTDYAQIRINNTNVGVSANTDSIVFRDVFLRGGDPARGSYDGDYVMNMATANITLNKLRLENCIIKIFRGIIRENGTGTRINNYLMNNCIIDSVKDFSVAQVSIGTGFGVIRFSNSTVYRSRKLITHSVAGSTCTSVLIENCTFNELPSNNGTNYFIDFNTINVTNGVTLKNCIFGKMWDDAAAVPAPLGFRAGGSTTLTISSCYSTSDFTLSGGAIGTSTYPGTAANLFTDPVNYNFKIKDASFVGKSTTGDPRWRIN